MTDYYDNIDAPDWGRPNALRPPVDDNPQPPRDFQRYPTCTCGTPGQCPRDGHLNRIPAKQLHRFHVDIWALDTDDAAQCFRDLVRDGLEAVEAHGFGHSLAAAPWEYDEMRAELAATRARLAAVESDFAHYMHVDDDWPDDGAVEAAMRDDGGPFSWERHPYEYDADGFVVGPHPVDDCPPHGIAREDSLGREVTS